MSITLTPAARAQVSRKLKARGHGLGLKVGVRTSGCSGLSYVLEYVDNLSSPAPLEFRFEEVSVFVDPRDLPYLDGIEIDFVRQGLNEGFEFNNPNAKQTCGCGESFFVG